MKKNNYYLEVPKFSFGAKAVIRPLPTSSSFKCSSIKTLSELKAYIKEKKHEKV